MKELKFTDLRSMEGLSFSGTRYLTSVTREHARSMFFSNLDWYQQFTTGHYGAARGIDTRAGEWTMEFNLPFKRRVVYVPADKSKVDWSFKDWATHVFYMPEGTDYKDRNEMLVLAGEALSAFPDYDEERGYRSGTWQAIRQARRLRRNLMVNIITGGDVLWEQNQLPT